MGGFEPPKPPLRKPLKMAEEKQRPYKPPKSQLEIAPVLSNFLTNRSLLWLETPFVPLLFLEFLLRH